MPCVGEHIVMVAHATILLPPAAIGATPRSCKTSTSQSASMCTHSSWAPQSGTIMGHVSHRRPTSVAHERTCVADRVLAFLRARYPMKMHEAVAADCRVSIATIRKLEERGSAPSLPLFWRMADAYGPAFVHAVFGFAWLDEAAMAARQRALEASIAAQSAELARLREVRP